MGWDQLSNANKASETIQEQPIIRPNLFSVTKIADEVRAQLLQHAVNEQKLTKELEKANKKISGYVSNAAVMKA